MNIRNFLVFNAVLLLIIKAALPFGGLQLATLIEQITPFDSRGIVAETNKVRSANNLVPLSPNAQLDLAASQKLNDMTVKNYFAHTSPQGATPWFWIEKNGYEYSYAGENLALGFFNPEETVIAWMNSPTHKANIINTNYQEIGVATGKGTINGISGILVVQLFGKSSPNKTVVVRPTKLKPPGSTPAPSFISSVTPESNIAGTKKENLQSPTTPPESRRNPIKLQYASTEDNASALEFPSEYVSNAKLPVKLDALYQIYIIITIVLMVFAAVFNGFNKKFAFATAINFSFLLISIITPSAVVTIHSLIF